MKKEKAPKIHCFSELPMLLRLNRGDGTRTHGLCVPNAALYQTEPRLDVTTDILSKYMAYVKDFFWIFHEISLGKMEICDMIDSDRVNIFK